MALQVNPERLRQNIEGIARFGRDPAGGWSRFVFTEEERKAREFVAGLLRQAGMSVRLDPAGNLFGRRKGAHPELPAVASGSHIDTVLNGGMFDGVAGTMAAIEAVQVIHENSITTQHPIEVVVFANEEGARFHNALWGSRAMLGIVQEEECLRCKDPDGVTLAEAMRAHGFDPSKIQEARIEAQRFKAFIELHPEQSHVLESEGVSIGVVEGIAGTAWMKARLMGRTDHAGATPMHLRRDALAAAAAVVLEVERIARRASDSRTVATVGRLEVRPGGINIVPGEVEMSFDVRDANAQARDRACEAILEAARRTCAERNIRIEVDELGKVMPVRLAGEIAGLIEEECREQGVSCRRLVSGAGHDAQLMALLCPTGMIFVPSVGGVSHSPHEKTEWGDMASGAQVLLNVLLRLSQ
jgi:allantoate deiminase